MCQNRNVFKSHGLFNTFYLSTGTRRLEVTLQNNQTLLSAFVGSNLRISGWSHKSYFDCCVDLGEYMDRTDTDTCTIRREHLSIFKGKINGITI